MMDPHRLEEKLVAAGCCITSAGIIAVSCPQLIRSFVETLKRIDMLEGEIRDMAAAQLFTCQRPEGE